MTHARLKAYKLPTFGGGLDHTYVWAEKLDGPTGKDLWKEQEGPLHKWGCPTGPGRRDPVDDNGHEIPGNNEVPGCSASGDLERAMVLGGRIEDQENASITWGFNGVCHQMANRILAETLNTVNAGVNGGNISALSFGYYGIHPLPIINDLFGTLWLAATAGCVAVWANLVAKAKLDFPPLLKLKRRGANTLPPIIEAYDACASKQISIVELREIECNYVLGTSLGIDVYNKIEQENFLDLMRDFDNGSGVFASSAKRPTNYKAISNQQLANILNEGVNLLVNESQKIFRSKDDQMKLFGDTSGRKVVLVEPELLTKLYGDVAGFMKACESMTAKMTEYAARIDDAVASS